MSQPDRATRLIDDSSVRLRIALGATAMFAIIFVVLAGVIVLHQSRAIRHGVDVRLEEAIAGVAGELDQLKTEWDETLLSRLAAERAGAAQLDQVLIGLFDEEANVIIASAAEVPESIIAVMQTLAGTASDSSRFASASVDAEAGGGGPAQRIAYRRIAGAGGSSYVLCMASSDEYARGAITQLVRTVGILVPIMLIAAGAASWYLAGVATAPLREAARFAHELDPEHLPDHVELHSQLPESRQLEQELERALRRLGDGYASHRRFITNVSHELKTPISVLLAQGQALLYEEGIDGRSRVFVESTIEELGRLGRLIEGLLTLTKVREGAAPARLERYAVNELVMDCVQSNAHYASIGQVALRPVLMEDGLERVVLCDRHLARVALDNIVRNAIRYSPEGEIVDVEARCDDERICIAVRDRGPGCPSRAPDRVSDRLAQAGKARSSSRGAGIGLEVAYGIMELHKGDMTVDRLEEGGCRFQLWFRRQSADGESDGASSEI